MDADLSLAKSRQRYLDAFHIPAAVVVVEDGATRIAAANRQFRSIGGDRADPTHARGLVAAIDAFLIDDAERHDVHWQQPGVGGRSFSVHLSRLTSDGAHDVRALVSLVDRTAEVETARSLRAEMLHDSLTGLPNRLAFGEAVEEAVSAENGTPFAVLSIDLSRFSRINECVGALAGDELIITVARRLMSTLREGDMLARLGGDEFGVLLHDLEEHEDAARAAERLRATLIAPIRLSELEIRVDCAIGGAIRDERVRGASDLLRNTQVALKRAKLSGRVEVYQQGEAMLARRRFSLETELRRAIDRQELHLAFQPLIDLRSGTTSGFEVLARWTDPLHGAIAPNEFIAVAEDCGLIVPLGRWVADAAIRTLRAWDERAGAPLPLKLAVNVSPVQLARDDVAAAIGTALAANHVAGERLTLELTESSIVGDPERARRSLAAINDLGCHVAIDDFGTGYTSLAYLQQLPIDVLKIDRSFVSDMLSNPDSVAIIRAILGLGRSLGMSTTAEGIEDAATAQMLARLGCDTGQGFHFARPLTEADALAFYEERSAAVTTRRAIA